MAEKLVRFDWAIKKLLRSKANFVVLEGFLTELLCREVKVVEVLDSESNKETADGKYNRLDVLVKDENGELILIEVQINDQIDFLSRLLFGVSRAISEHMKKGNSYKQVKKVYSIAIMFFDIGHGKDYVYDGSTSFVGRHFQDVLEMSEEQKEEYNKQEIKDVFPEYFLIKVNQFDDVAKDTLDEWIYFLKNSEIPEEFSAKGLAEAKMVLKEINLDEEQRREYNWFLEDLHYQASMFLSSYGQGVKEGVAKGREEGVAKVAENMVKMGLEDEVISQATGIGIEEIAEMRKR